MRASRGQATTEVVLLLPLFMFFLFAFAKIFAMLVLVQKMEIASYYAARRWQLESHRNVVFEGWDSSTLRQDIQNKVSEYLGYGTRNAAYLNLEGRRADLDIQRKQVWNIVTLKVVTRPFNTPLLKSRGFTFQVVKYVPNRDRPIAFVLPGAEDKKADKSGVSAGGRGSGGSPSP